MSGLDTVACLADLGRRARRRLPGFVFNYVEGGAGEERGVRRNAAAFGDILLRARRLAGPVGPSTVRLFGRDYAQPFGIPPIGMANLAWPGTDLAFAALARDRNIPFVLSTAASTAIEKAARAAPDVTWFQLYVSTDDAVTDDFLARAKGSGIDVLVLTVDVPAPGRRNRGIRDRFSQSFRYTPRTVAQLAMRPHWSLATLAAGKPNLENYAPYSAGGGANAVARSISQLTKWGLTWDDLSRLRERWDGTLVVKGISEAEDALEAVRRGADGIWVSNHGGRQLESAPATIDVLPEIADALNGSAPILFDSGIRTGEDVVKALALGATMSFAGRGFVYGAAAGGPAGVAKAYEILAAEVKAALGQIGCPGLDRLDRSCLRGLPESRPAASRPASG